MLNVNVNILGLGLILIRTLSTTRLATTVVLPRPIRYGLLICIVEDLQAALSHI